MSRRAKFRRHNRDTS